MIATVTPNPCIDYNLQVDELVRNSTARPKGALFFPGGAGINAARAITLLGGVPVKALGLTGGHVGALLKSLLDSEKVAHDFIDTGLETRINVLLTLTPDRSMVRVNAAGPECVEEHGTKLSKQLLSLDPEPKVVILGGSLPGRKIPPGVPRDYYARVIDELKTKKPKIRVVLDCAEGVALGHGVDKGPYVVEVNEAELGRLAGRKTLETEKDAVVAVEGLLPRGSEYFVVTRGVHGALVIGKTERYRVTHSDGVGLSRVGAADAFVGALAWSLAKDEPIDVAAKWALAVGTATVLSPASAMFRREEVDAFLAKTHVERM